jgi:hypothetical protein
VRANHFKMSLRATQAFHYDVSIDRLLSEEEVAKQAARKERKGGVWSQEGWGNNVWPICIVLMPVPTVTACLFSVSRCVAQQLLSAHLRPLS